MSIQFQIFPDHSGAFDYSSNATKDAGEKVDELADLWQQGRLSEKRFQAALEQQLQQTPWLLDAHVFLASNYFDLGKPVKALEAAQRGLDAAHDIMPDGFSGRVEWGHLENRAYLRMLQIALLCLSRRRKHKEAAEIAVLMLARNPNDNQGVRFVVGSELLRAGMRKEAAVALQEHAADYPPYWYELGLCHAIDDNWVAAATAFRRGFAANHYIAELLLNESEPWPLLIHHGSNLEDPSTAIEYVNACGDLWLAPNGAERFLRWLYNQSQVLMERAGILACKEELLWAANSADAAKIVQRLDALTSKIDDKLSKAIVQQRTTRRGQTGWPWNLALGML
ncbi:hypothetical protein ACN9MZ_00095 [Pseudoduganella sp. S-14]|jgi:tetratricopeptide (TPR) repeat protein|uniref:hypothetical protein n=1 Tax=Pseudoduganella sp. S-14 TaxID=3404065 RepID=UPI003CEB6A76